ncbi:MAG: hypothetical protein Q4F24_14845 [Eubacteriales bacterium]|nr:hypothetical protein [Eubacteriales bacterium]
MAMPLVSVVLIVVDMFLLAMGKYDHFNSGQFLRMAVLLVIVNIAVFVILEKYTGLMKHEMELVQEKNKWQSDAYLMEIAAKNMKERLQITESSIQNDQLMRHDRRHFEAALYQLLEEGNTEKAKKYLAERLAIVISNLLEIENSCDRKVILDEDGYPFSREEDHGIGTRSVVAFVNKTDSEICYLTEGTRFRVRMII